jgi:hypothetical protein
MAYVQTFSLSKATPEPPKVKFGNQFRLSPEIKGKSGVLYECSYNTNCPNTLLQKTMNDLVYASEKRHIIRNRLRARLAEKKNIKISPEPVEDANCCGSESK